jgi:hypothetical protein
VAELKQELAAAIVERDNADIISCEVVLQVVNSVKGDPNHGEDSPLYDALGYVRKSARKSGQVVRRGVFVTGQSEVRVSGINPRDTSGCECG